MKLVIDQVATKKPGAEEHRQRFNQDVLHSDSVEELLEDLDSKFGIKPPKRIKGVFIDTKSQGTVQVGFIAARWVPNERGGGSYWEENWITFMTERRAVVPLPKRLQANI